MDKFPNFSVVIPSYNCANQLANALESVCRQTCGDFEVLISDSSSDHTRQVIEGFSGKLDIKYFWEESRGGPAGPRNTCVKAARGEYIAFLDADDWWYPDKLAAVKKQLDRYAPDVLYHGLDIYKGDGRKGRGQVKTRKLKKPIFSDLMKNTNTLFTSAVVARKEIIQRAGGFREGDILEDFDLWLRISRFTEKFHFMPRALGDYRLGPDSRSGASEKMLKMIQSVYRDNINFLSAGDLEEAERLSCYLLARTRLRMGQPEEALGLFRKSAGSASRKFRHRSVFWILYINFFRLIRGIRGK